MKKKGISRNEKWGKQKQNLNISSNNFCANTHIHKSTDRTPSVCIKRRKMYFIFIFNNDLKYKQKLQS